MARATSAASLPNGEPADRQLVAAAEPKCNIHARTSAFLSARETFIASGQRCGWARPLKRWQSGQPLSFEMHSSERTPHPAQQTLLTMQLTHTQPPCGLALRFTVVQAVRLGVSSSHGRILPDPLLARGLL